VSLDNLTSRCTDNHVIANLSVLVLADDRSSRNDLVAQHGLALWIEADDQRILFDTAQGNALIHNAGSLGVDIHRADAVVLSHGHYDHSGGLVCLAPDTDTMRLFLHPDALNARYVRRNSPLPTFIGMPDPAGAVVHRLSDRTTCTRTPTRIADGIWVTGAIPRCAPFETTGDAFFCDPDCRVIDPIHDDQAVWIRTSRGPVVLLGCAHAGVVNTLDYIGRLAGSSAFLAVIGGMHLLHADRTRLEITADALQRYRVELVAPCHCTGDNAMSFLRQKLPGRYVVCVTGSRFSLA